MGINDQIKEKGEINKYLTGFFNPSRDTVIVNIRTLERLYDEYDKYIGINTNIPNTTSSIYNDFKGKEGIYRSKTEGKIISGNVARVVISCAKDISIDEAKLPMYFVETMQIMELVTPFNVELLRKFVDNKGNYPGCRRIWSKKMNKIINNIQINYNIQPGDIIYRNVVNGDEILLNRSPTLYLTSICYHKVVVHEGIRPTFNLAINVTSCTAYNADFDGDAMFMKAVTSPEARVEAEYLLAFDRYLLGYGDATPSIGLVQDSVIGCTLLTMSRTVLSRFEAMSLFSNIPIDFELTKEKYSGRELFSMVMPPINYRAKSAMFKESFMKDFGDFDESDYEIVIENGILKSGIVCGGAIKAKAGSIYHIIACNIGKKEAMKIVDYHQQICDRFLELHGTTMTYRDIRLNNESKELLGLIKSRIARELGEFYNKVMTKSVRPPVGKSMAEFVEDTVINILSDSKSMMSAILKTVDPTNNWLFMYVASGAKGTFDNILRSLASYGLLKINNKLIDNTLGEYRFGIHSKQFSDDPLDRGYIPNSLVEGLEPRNILAVGMETRRNVLTKGLTVSVAGYKGRIIIKAVGSAVVDQRNFTCRGFGTKIIEFHNLDDGFKPCNAQDNKIETILMDDVDIEKRYEHRADLIKADRDEVLRRFDHLQNINPTFRVSNMVKLPIDIDQIISSSNRSKGDYKKNAVILDEFLDNLYHLRFNRIHQIKKTNIPEFLRVNFFMLKVALRSKFDKATLEKYDKEGLELLLNLIGYKIVDSFFEPGDVIGIIMGQSLGSPLTQYLIDSHHKSVTGGTSRDGLEYCDNILIHKKAQDIKTNLTYVFLDPKYEEVKQNALVLSDYITSKKLSSVLKYSEVLYEKPGEFATYVDDKKEFNSYIKEHNIHFSSDRMYPVYFRLVVDKKQLSAKNITMHELFNKIEKVYEDKVIPVEYEKDGEIIIMLFFVIGFNWEYLNRLSDRKKETKLNSNVWVNVLKFYDEFINETTINSFQHINSVKIAEMEKKYISEGKVKSRKIYYLITNGINLEDLLVVNIVDGSRTTTNNVLESYTHEGIMSAKQTVVRELYNTLNGPLDMLPTTFTLFANIMLETGEPTPISDIGQKAREPNEILTRMSISNPSSAMLFAATNGGKIDFNTHTSDIILGQVPRYIGTGRNPLVLNEKFMIEHYREKTEEDFI